VEPSHISRCHWKHRFAGDDQSPLHQSAELQLAKQKPRHDRLAGAGVVGKQNGSAEAQHEVVDASTWWQRIDREIESEKVGVVLVGKRKPLRLDPELK